VAVYPEDAERLEELLARHEALDHLRVKKWGSSLIIFSGEGRDQQKHARLTELGRDVWGLSLPRHTGSWERTPFVGSMEELVGALTSDFAFYLEQW